MSTNLTNLLKEVPRAIDPTNVSMQVLTAACGAPDDAGLDNPLMREHASADWNGTDAIPGIRTPGTPISFGDFIGQEWGRMLNPSRTIYDTPGSYPHVCHPDTRFVRIQGVGGGGNGGSGAQGAASDSYPRGGGGGGGAAGWRTLHERQISDISIPIVVGALATNTTAVVDGTTLIFPGGANGTNGLAGNVPNKSGGAGGNNGQGGVVSVPTSSANPPAVPLTGTIGNGGAGGAANSNTGSSGRGGFGGSASPGGAGGTPTTSTGGGAPGAGGGGGTCGTGNWLDGADIGSGAVGGATSTGSPPVPGNATGWGNAGAGGGGGGFSSVMPPGGTGTTGRVVIEEYRVNPGLL